MKISSKMGRSLMLGILLTGCTVDVEDPGSLPDVDVSGGQLPKIDVQRADVRVTTDTQEVRVPHVDVEKTE